MKRIEMNVPCKFPTVLLGQYAIPNAVKPMEIYIKSPIEWLVLEVNTKERKALLLSKYALEWEGFADCPVIGQGYKTSWENSYLRQWLNKSFYNDCFNVEEQSLIVPTHITPEVRGAKKTLDNIFLLSEKDIRKYFAMEGTAKAYEPMISIGNGKEENPIELEYIPCFWWTRTPGKTSDLVMCVDLEGFLCELDSDCDETGVRPALWVKI